MKNKIILITFLLIALLGTTIVLATDELEVRNNINARDLVGENETNEEVENNVSDEDLVATPVVTSLDMTEPINEDSFKTTTTQTKRGDLYVLEDNASIENDVDGNLFIIADNVDISGNVYGNVFVMGNNINLKSSVSGSVFALGNNLKFVKGQITDAYFFGTNISIEEDAAITREAKMAADHIKISGVIMGDVYTQAESVLVEESGNITGKLVYSGELSQANEKQIGSTEKQEINVTPSEVKPDFQNKVESILYKTVTALFIIGLMVLIIDKKFENKITVSDSIKGIIGGIVWVIVIPIVSIILMLTIIGLPFALILLTLYVLMFFVAISALSLQISSYILNVKNKDSKVLLWLLGVVIYCALAILRQIPTLGGIITFIAGLYGFNLIIKTLFPKKKKESQIVKE